MHRLCPKLCRETRLFNLPKSCLKALILQFIILSIVIFFNFTQALAAQAKAALDNRQRPPAARPIDVNAVALPLNTILINNGANYTTNRQVRLSLNTPNNRLVVRAINQMRFSNDNANWSQAEAYANTKQWALSEGVGNKTVYVQFLYVGAANWSASFSDTILFDNTPPVITAVSDDGDTTFNRTTLHATWQAQEDGSPITEYQYSIGTSPGNTDIVNWTSTGTNTEVTANNLVLRVGSTYYFNLKARNAAGLWSEVTSSDGIRISNRAPQILSLTPQDNAKFQATDTIEIAVRAQDPDRDTLEYRYLVDGNVLLEWCRQASYSWQTQQQDTHLKTIRVEVRDSPGAQTAQETRVFLYRKPPQPN